MGGGLGSWGEERAVDHLLTQGYRILERNFRVWEGEIDVVAEKDGTIIFVEVKTRSSSRFGAPEESMTSTKRRRLYWAGYRYLEANACLDSAFRFDLIAIECSKRRDIQRLTHYEDVIGVDGWE